MFTTTTRILKKSLLCIGVASVLLATFGPFAWTKDIEDCLEGLRSWELAKQKENFVSVRLPEKIQPLSIGKDEALRDFEVGVALFHSVWSNSVIGELRAVAEEGISGGIPEDRVPELKARLKEFRGSLKMLRFLYEGLSSDHERPSALDELTVAVGKLRDVIQGKRGGANDVPDAAKRLGKALKPARLEELEKEIRAFKPARRSSFDRWLKKTVRETEEILQQKKGTPDRFHDARKKLQAILALYEVEMEFHPENTEWEPIALYLLQETEEIGDQQGLWEKKDTSGRIDFKKDKVRYPRELTLELLAFLRRIQF